jgi:hypothetical protein
MSKQQRQMAIIDHYTSGDGSCNTKTITLR